MDSFIDLKIFKVSVTFICCDDSGESKATKEECRAKIMENPLRFPVPRASKTAVYRNLQT
jgi:hypothetical protein